ncbi:hypothetical protein [Streptomyces anulatus]
MACSATLLAALGGCFAVLLGWQLPDAAVVAVLTFGAAFKFFHTHMN